MIASPMRNISTLLRRPHLSRDKQTSAFDAHDACDPDICDPSVFSLPLSTRPLPTRWCPATPLNTSPPSIYRSRESTQALDLRTSQLTDTRWAVHHPLGLLSYSTQVFTGRLAAVATSPPTFSAHTIRSQRDLNAHAACPEPVEESALHCASADALQWSTTCAYD
ncbi:hypothetical protein OH76DRAFT_282393 [Lentinus brumalis]|uniref:Uncharacterized protein n=1 Tax=Lentinus brumalis TaxID=2498619 RepID=A0A371CKT0_9APHY|nr:hypothetical protein OH76DRAFT_282393 [Polyporus brumalis]